jgi:hypothetical protein
VQEQRKNPKTGTAPAARIERAFLGVLRLGDDRTPSAFPWREMRRTPPGVLTCGCCHVHSRTVANVLYLVSMSSILFISLDDSQLGLTVGLNMGYGTARYLDSMFIHCPVWVKTALMQSSAVRCTSPAPAPCSSRMSALSP